MVTELIFLISYPLNQNLSYSLQRYRTIEKFDFDKAFGDLNFFVTLRVFKIEHNSFPIES